MYKAVSSMKESQAFLVAPMNGALAKKLSVALLAITLTSCGSGENALVRAHSALDKALRLSHSCSQVAERLTSLPVPDDHGEARMKQATNEWIEQNDHPAPLHEIDQAHTEYANAMVNGSIELKHCLAEYKIARRDLMDALQQLSGRELSAEEVAILKWKHEAYLVSNERFREEVMDLTDHPQTQSYVTHAVTTHVVQ